MRSNLKKRGVLADGLPSLRGGFLKLDVNRYKFGTALNDDQD